MHGEGLVRGEGRQTDGRRGNEVQGGWVLLPLALLPVCDNLSVGLSLPICKLKRTFADVGWREGQEVRNEQVPAAGAAPTLGRRQAQSGPCR